MSNTKQKIVEQALKSFNDRGLGETSLRQIAKDLGMSQGNLTYHFKHKHEIVEKLYFNLVKELDVEFQKLSQPNSLLLHVFQSSGLSMQIMYRYRFILRDFYSLMQSNPNLKSHYSALQDRRKAEFQNLFTVLKAQGIMRSELFEKEYDRLYERMNILGDNWINTQELLNQNLKNPIRYYQELLFEVIFPYLTEKGQKEYQTVLKMG